MPFFHLKPSSGFLLRLISKPHHNLRGSLRSGPCLPLYSLTSSVSLPSSINIFQLYWPNLTPQNTSSLFLPRGLCMCLEEVPSIFCCGWNLLKLGPMFSRTMCLPWLSLYTALYHFFFIALITAWNYFKFCFSDSPAGDVNFIKEGDYTFYPWINPEHSGSMWWTNSD